jgi:gas vesicle protein
MAQDNGSNLGWFIAGAIVGAVGALLYAPQSGHDTRRYIGKSALEGKDALGESGRELMERGKELYERGKRISDDAGELFERGKKLVQS